MLSSKLSLIAALLLALSQRVAADVGVTPALGVSGTFTEDDVQEFLGQRCGTIDIASNIDNSTAVTANADGSFDVTGSSFATGADGSTTVTAVLDTTGTGDSFNTGLQISKNGVAIQKTKPNNDPLTAVLPDNTTCTGGATGDRCLVAFQTGGGFSNCVVVTQANSTSNASNSTSTSASSKKNKGNASSSTQADKKAKAKAAAAAATAKGHGTGKNNNSSNSTTSATASNSTTTSGTNSTNSTSVANSTTTKIKAIEINLERRINSRIARIIQDRD